MENAAPSMLVIMIFAVIALFIISPTERTDKKDHYSHQEAKNK